MVVIDSMGDSREVDLGVRKSFAMRQIRRHLFSLCFRKVQDCDSIDWKIAVSTRLDVGFYGLDCTRAE